ncbi:MAG: crotonobetainyl-CoA dehydrogenase [Propionibacteriaceae bacterium]|jgi:crotonobetainyl-CoA dehydrogenase|nr:crotonobetainyl-CoA dehydrogenase [Propionibacteriaceae bacterium]
MDFALNDEQQLFVENFRELMERENWEPYFAECDKTHTYPERWVKALCELGFDQIMLPEEHGGLDLGLVTLMSVYEELGRLGGPTYILYQLPCFDTILREGTQEQINKIMAYVGTGKQIWNSACTEPGAGSDVGSLQTTYTRKNGKIYLNGHKTFITSSAKVPFLVVMARDSENYDTFTEFFLDMSLPGIKIEPLEKLGLRMDSCSDVYLDNVELDESDIFGTEGNGFRRGIGDFDLERFLVGASDYSSALCAFEDAAKYANVRVQFGKTIGRFQLNQLKFAEMAIKLKAMKYMLYEAAWSFDQGEMTSAQAAMCKYYGANASAAVVDAAMQVMAGVAVAGDHRIQRIWRDLRVDRVSGGTDEMMILTLAKGVLREYAA